MRSIKQAINAVMVFALMSTALGISVQAQAQRRAYGLNDGQVKQIIKRLETGTSKFQRSLTAALNSSRLNGTWEETDINNLVRNFQDATGRLSRRYTERALVAADVEAALNSAATIDDFMRRNRLAGRAASDWAALRPDLTALANNYSVASNQNPYRTNPASNQNANADARMTGTYRLDPSRSENPRDAADRVTSNLSDQNRQRVYNGVLYRLEAPEQLALQRRGNSMTMSSTRAPQTSFVADGRQHNEQLANGRTMRSSARYNGDQLAVSSNGSRENDFTVTFDPIENGQGLRLTRRIFSEGLAQPVVFQSIYNRTSNDARFDLYDAGSANNPSTSDSRNYPRTIRDSVEATVRDGDTLQATLNTNLSTSTSHDGDRFTMTVSSPAQFEGAVIEGAVSNMARSGRASGRSQMSFDFDSIRMQNGQTHAFDGVVEGVRTAAGKNVQVDNEGGARDSNQTKTTVLRTAIGGGVGAIIGAIVGGGKGAAIGAGIGAGAGIGSVYIQGRDDLDLASGSQVTIRVSSTER